MSCHDVSTIDYRYTVKHARYLVNKCCCHIRNQLFIPANVWLTRVKSPCLMVEYGLITGLPIPMGGAMGAPTTAGPLQRARSICESTRSCFGRRFGIGRGN